MEAVRSAAGFEGLIALAVVYWVLAAIAKAGKKAARTPRPVPPPAHGGPAGGERERFSLEAVLREIERVRQQAEGGARTPVAPPGPLPHQERPRRSNPAARGKPPGTAPRHLSDVTQNPRHLSTTDRRGRMAAALTDRGPMGRHGSSRLPSSEEFEDRTSLEEGALEETGRLDILDESRTRPREVVDQDEGAEAVVLRRIQEAEARNRPFSEKDHRRFHEQIATAAPREPGKPRLTNAQLRQAFVWREILGPPKSLE